ncbi:uncharacterized protein ACA1_260530 [Acanthamoeba castellanii str. Neff]|uniref:Myb-like domain-containing protein n=1 Tax=Acanthamoeba castellanii (strain ATCC 30010 / Neff) TaxID=1257118 RepID=L8GFP8_ACACF|nr:uncharacterized protein ACA1_260530 [Acanthamoeba castellanii str. Neff]ELR11669.1 hypothetical protein ACA1_260530 [Acanthamoeba castellanii str. Neff]
MEEESKNRYDITEEELHSLNRRELFAFKKESSALKFQTQGWRKKSVSESIFKKWTKDEHIKFVAGLKELGLSAAAEVSDGDWIKLSQLVAGRSAYDVKLHARVFWQSPAAAAAEEQQAAQQAGLKREFVQPSPTVEARKKQRPDSPEGEAAPKSGNSNTVAVADETMDAVLSGSLSLTSSMLGLYLSSAADDTLPSSSPLTEPSSLASPSSSSSAAHSALPSMMPNSAATGGGGAEALVNPFGFGGDAVSVVNMNDIMANQLLEENVQIITIIRENLVNGSIKINYSLMRKFAANISRILKWQSMQPPASLFSVLTAMPPLTYMTSGVTGSPPSLFPSSSSPSSSASSALSSSSSPPSAIQGLGVNSTAPIIISPPSSPGIISFGTGPAFG